VVTKPGSLCALAADEDGASYHLGFALILPFYVLLIVCTIELALMLNAKIAVTHAAYAAARAASVWLSAKDIPEEGRLGMVHLAAVNALAPIASGRHAIPSQT
jgi:Flp pilus assembly protein TadG